MSKPQFNWQHSRKQIVGRLLKAKHKKSVYTLAHYAQVEGHKPVKFNVENVVQWVQDNMEPGRPSSIAEKLARIVPPFPFAQFFYTVSGEAFLGIAATPGDAIPLRVDMRAHGKGQDEDIDYRDWPEKWHITFDLYSPEYGYDDTYFMSFSIDTDGFLAPTLPFKVHIPDELAQFRGPSDHVWESFNDRLSGLGATGVVYLMPVLAALSFMNCKNVEQVDETDRRVPSRIRPSRQVIRARERAGEPVVQRKVLLIDPMGRKRKSSAPGQKTGRTQSFHICRGHFRTYTEDAPLFGKVAGTFYFAPHVRGNRSKGVVEKEYRIGIPEDNDE